ncbi:TetR/AcrR family transcriptional regulator [Schlesneria paludicola]|uniref:TetR/AcrR family transcriptional regulator n=1 Tax=Schlesneria paludicola TaxID=360056 RepID=UPI000299E061|nr:TetR/AcrR family transcriptional regulator [Schlesneria paludicola]
MNDTDPTSKASATHGVILTAAVNVFAAEGFRNTDVQVIADRANVGKGTVYRHFGNKAQLFVATAQFCIEQLGEFVSHQLGKHPTIEAFIEAKGAAELLHRIARACAQFYQQNPPFLEIMIQERVEFREAENPLQVVFRQNARAGLDRIMEIGIKRGEFRKGDATSVSDAFSDLLYGCLVKGCFEGDASKLVERVEHAIELLLNGIVRRSPRSTG